MDPNVTQTAVQKRAAHPDFIPTFSLQALEERLPFHFPVPEGLAPSPKTRYRSQYHYLGYEELLRPGVVATLTPFEIALRLIDFSPPTALPGPVLLLTQCQGADPL